MKLLKNFCSQVWFFLSGVGCGAFLGCSLQDSKRLIPVPIVLSSPKSRAGASKAYTMQTIAIATSFWLVLLASSVSQEASLSGSATDTLL